MSDLDPTQAFTDELCLRCGYRRQGLAAETACPECGAVPDAAAICLRGASDSAPPWVAILVGGVSALLLCAFLAMFVHRLAVGRGPNVNFAATWGIVMGLAFGLRGLRRWRMRERGGDIVWVLDEDGLAVRVGRSIAHVDARDLPRFKVERKLAAKRTGVVLRPKGLWNSLTTHRLWAVRGDPAVERMLEALRERGATLAA